MEAAEWDEWLQAEAAQMGELAGAETWSLVPREDVPHLKKVITGRWV